MMITTLGSTSIGFGTQILLSQDNGSLRMPVVRSVVKKRKRAAEASKPPLRTLLVASAKTNQTASVASKTDTNSLTRSTERTSRTFWAKRANMGYDASRNGWNTHFPNAAPGSVDSRVAASTANVGDGDSHSSVLLACIGRAQNKRGPHN